MFVSRDVAKQNACVLSIATMPLFLFVFAQTHPEFRIPELRSISELHGFHVELIDRDPSRPFMVISLESEEHAKLLAGRCILIKSVLFRQGCESSTLAPSSWGSDGSTNSTGEDVPMRSYTKATKKANLYGEAISRIPLSSSP